MDQLPSYLIVIPLLAAPLAVILPGRVVQWLLATVVSFIVLAIAGMILAQVMETGAISYAMGGWPPPWGIEIRVDIHVGVNVCVRIASGKHGHTDEHATDHQQNEIEREHDG